MKNIEEIEVVDYILMPTDPEEGEVGGEEGDESIPGGGIKPPPTVEP